MWGSWLVMPMSKSQIKKLRDISNTVFWTKMGVLLAIITIIGFLLFKVINM